ncbi:hypothetical protein EDD11_001864 [Mortierella claussenii]|nr:hypothetical protein EDD11_001864 [Mortierella claussenii]
MSGNPSPPTHALLLPEIILAVGSHLHQHDLTNALRVCHVWYATLEYLLWVHSQVPYRSQVPHDPKRSPNDDQILQNARRIRSLSIQETPSSLLQQTGFPLLFPHLVHLNVFALSPYVLDILKGSDGTATTSLMESLNCRHMPNPEVQPQLVTEFWLVLRDMPRLRSLELMNAALGRDQAPIFWEVAQKLERLGLIHTYHFCSNAFRFYQPRNPPTQGAFQADDDDDDNDNDVDDDDDDDTIGLVRNAIQWTNMKSLKLHCVSNLDSFEIFKRCPNLEQLEWRAHTYTNTTELLRVFFEITLQQQQYMLQYQQQQHAFHTSLQDLDLCFTDMSDVALTRILKQLPHLLKFRVCGSQFGPQAAEFLLQHKPDLHSLEIQNCRDIPSATIQRMLETFRELRTFKATYLKVQDMVTPAPTPPLPPAVATTATTEAVAVAPGDHLRPWACDKMEDFSIVFTDLSTAGSPTLVRHLIYSQLSRLYRLRTLSVGENRMLRGSLHPPILDMTLQNGLGQLATLAQLETLDVQLALPRMTLTEAQWMIRSWPRLRKLVGNVAGPHDTEIVYQYLQEKHPNLRFSVRQNFTC